MTATTGLGELRCPVCRARVAGSVVCGRCKADLTGLWRAAATALNLREKGRKAVLRERYSRGIRYLKRSLKIHESPRARQFLFLARLLKKRPMPDLEKRF